MEKIKIIATDLDGTLLNNKGLLTDETKNIIIKVIRQNMQFIPISGRTVNSVKTIFDKLPITYIVSNNGATIYSLEKEKVLFSAAIDLNICFSIVNAYATILDNYTFCSDFIYYISEKKEWNDYRQPIQTFSSFKKEQVEIVKLELFFKKEIDLTIIKNDIEKRNPNLSAIIMRSSYSNVYWIEVMQKNVDKGGALVQLTNLLNCNLSSTVSFGDGFNDIPMLKTSGIGVAMNNAFPDAKKEADEITLSNEEEGVIKWLEQNKIV